MGIAEATVATAAALAPARVASAHATQTCSKHQSVAQCKNSFFFKKKEKIVKCSCWINGCVLHDSSSTSRAALGKGEFLVEGRGRHDDLSWDGLGGEAG